jgi:hypothetical protein
MNECMNAEEYEDERSKNQSWHQWFWADRAARAAAGIGAGDMEFVGINDLLPPITWPISCNTTQPTGVFRAGGTLG